MNTYYHLTHTPKKTVVGCMHYGTGFVNTWRNAIMIMLTGLRFGLTGNVMFKVSVPNNQITVSQQLEE